MCGESLEFGPDGWVICQVKTAMLTRINTSVTIGNRPVGMLSLSGIRGGEAYFAGLDAKPRAPTAQC